jgi:hypothetical protein
MVEAVERTVDALRAALESGDEEAAWAAIESQPVVRILDVLDVLEQVQREAANCVMVPSRALSRVQTLLELRAVAR